MTTNPPTGATIPLLILDPLSLPNPHDPALHYRVTPHPRCLSDRFIMTKMTKTQDWSFPCVFTSQQFFPELSDLSSLLSNFHNNDVQAEEDGPDNEPFSGYSWKSINSSQEGLPHILLQPFCNQAGGHNAIYKFTK